MVREVVTVAVGQCGNQIAWTFWEKAMMDHKLDLRGEFQGNIEEKGDKQRLEKIGVFFDQTSKQRHVPRAIFADLEPGVLDKLRNTRVGAAFAPDRFINGVNGAGNCWASGFFSEGNEVCPEIMDQIRIEFEKCDCPQAVQTVHSVGGGTGSGLGSLLLEKLASHYLSILRCDYTVYPSKSVSDTVVEPYNTICSMPHLIENCDANFVLDNEAIFNISNNVVKAGRSNMELNNLITSAMLGVTASLRFTGWLNCDLRKLATNLVPFPRLHFFLISEAPLVPARTVKYGNVENVRDLITQMISPEHYFAQIDPEKGKFLTVAAMFRGDVSTSYFEDETHKLQNQMSDDFVNWIPDRFKTSSVTVPSPTSDMSTTFVGNTTAMKQMFQRISKQFKPLFRRKAFLGPYKQHGMDEMMFQEAHANVLDLIKEYQDRQDVVVDLETLYEEQQAGYLDDDLGDVDDELLSAADQVDVPLSDGAANGGVAGDAGAIQASAMDFEDEFESDDEI